MHNSLNMQLWNNWILIKKKIEINLHKEHFLTGNKSTQGGAMAHAMIFLVSKETDIKPGINESRLCSTNYTNTLEIEVALLFLILRIQL